MQCADVDISMYTHLHIQIGSLDMCTYICIYTFTIYIYIVKCIYIYINFKLHYTFKWKYLYYITLYWWLNCMNLYEPCTCHACIINSILCKYPGRQWYYTLDTKLLCLGSQGYYTLEARQGYSLNPGIQDKKKLGYPATLEARGTKPWKPGTWQGVPHVPVRDTASAMPWWLYHHPGGQGSLLPRKSLVPGFQVRSKNLIISPLE